MSEENRRLKSAPAMAAAATVSDDGSIAPSVTPSPRGEHAPSPASPVKPCPFCASTKLRAKDDAEQGYKWGAIECEECSARGPEVRTGYDKPEKWRPAAIEEWNRRTPAPSPAYTEPTAKECLAVYAGAVNKADVPGSIPSERHRAGIEAVLAFCLNRAPDAEYLKSYADSVLKAHERVKVNLHESDRGIAVNEVMPDGLEARVVFMPWDLIDEMRPARKPATVNPGLSETPASKQAAKELDELLNVFARRGDDDGDAEDCWTQPARRARQYVSDLRWDLEVTASRAAFESEANKSLRLMVADLAGYAGTTFGADEPVKNCEVVKKALEESDGRNAT